MFSVVAVRAPGLRYLSRLHRSRTGRREPPRCLLCRYRSGSAGAARARGPDNGCEATLPLFDVNGGWSSSTAAEGGERGGGRSDLHRQGPPRHSPAGSAALPLSMVGAGRSARRSMALAARPGPAVSTARRKGGGAPCGLVWVRRGCDGGGRQWPWGSPSSTAGSRSGTPASAKC